MFSANVNGGLLGVGQADLLGPGSGACSSFQTRKRSWFFTYACCAELWLIHSTRKGIRCILVGTSKAISVEERD